MARRREIHQKGDQNSEVRQAAHQCNPFQAEVQTVNGDVVCRDVNGEGDGGAEHERAGDFLAPEVNLDGVDEGLKQEGWDGESEIGNGCG